MGRRSPVPNLKGRRSLVELYPRREKDYVLDSASTRRRLVGSANRSSRSPASCSARASSLRSWRRRCTTPERLLPLGVCLLIFGATAHPAASWPSFWRRSLATASTTSRSQPSALPPSVSPSPVPLAMALASPPPPPPSAGPQHCRRRRRRRRHRHAVRLAAGGGLAAAAASPAPSLPTFPTPRPCSLLPHLRRRRRRTLGAAAVPYIGTSGYRPGRRLGRRPRRRPHGRPYCRRRRRHWRLFRLRRRPRLLRR